MLKLKSGIARAKRAFQCRCKFGATQAHIAGKALRVAFFLFELKNGRQGVVVAGVEAAGVDLHVLDERNVKNPGGAARAALGRKVVDDRHLDAIQIKYIFVGRAAANNDVVAEAAHQNTVPPTPGSA